MEHPATTVHDGDPIVTVDSVVQHRLRRHGRRDGGSWLPAEADPKPNSATALSDQILQDDADGKPGEHLRTNDSVPSAERSIRDRRAQVPIRPSATSDGQGHTHLQPVAAHDVRGASC